jgi:hypothetical protein
MALDSYKTSRAPSIHDQIRDYAQQSTFMQILKSNNAQQKVIEMIQKASPLLQEERSEDGNAPEITTYEAGFGSGNSKVKNVSKEISKVRLLW